MTIGERLGRKHRWWLALPLFALGLAACASNTTSSSTTQSTPTPSHQLAVKAVGTHALTFYEGDEDSEPFTPFLVNPGPDHTILAFGFSQDEGAFYIAAYNTTTWDEESISNGFGPTDPQWSCDQSPELSTSFDSAATLMARTCADGSMTVFALPDALALYHQGGSTGDVALASRSPVAVFAPNGATLALTDDGPSGPGQHIALLAVPTWQTLRSLTLANPLLSRPAWSPDGSLLAVTTLDGTLHILQTATGQDIADAALPHFALNSAASDPAGPAPQWSPDGTLLYVTTPTQNNQTIVSAWHWHNDALTAGATATIAFTPNQANPQLAPDGSYLLLHTSLKHGQLFTAPALQQVSDFALPGPLTAWADAQDVIGFTLNATAVVYKIG